MSGFLYKLFSGSINLSESIKVDSEEFRVALHQLIETHKQLRSELSTEQLLILDELMAQKDSVVAFEIYESFLIGIKLAFGLWEEVLRK